MAHPLVYVLVINWNGREHLDACLTSLLQSDYPSFRVVLIDNASVDGSVEWAQGRFGGDDRFEALQLTQNRGWSGGNNAGLRRALDEGADYAFLLNNDTATDPGAIAALTAQAEADPSIGALAARMLLFDQPDILNSIGLECSVIGSCWDRGLGRIDRPAWDTPVEVVGACGGAAFLRADAVREAGPLPEDFGIYLDDLDLCLRMWRAGYRVAACPAARVRHKFSATMGEGARARTKYYLNTRNRFRLVARNWPARASLATAGAMALGEVRAAGSALRGGEAWRVGAHARAMAAAATHLPRDVRARPAGTPAFWHLVRRRPLFFPGVPLPEDGWYAEETLPDGSRAQPMARRAWRTTPGGRLRLTLANCYPECGPAKVTIQARDEVIAELEAAERAGCAFDAPPGRLEFTAQRLFVAEDTGRPHDAGGWLALRF